MQTRPTATIIIGRLFVGEGVSGRGTALLCTCLALFIGVHLGTSPEPFFLPINTSAHVSAWLGALYLGLAIAAVALALSVAAADDEPNGKKLRSPVWVTLWPLAAAGITWHWAHLTITPSWHAFVANLALFVAGVVIVVALLGRPVALVAAAGIAMGVTIRHFYFAAIVIDVARADMLPLVTKALDNLLVGRSPYAIHEMPWPLPLTYLPGTFLPYQIPRWLGLDMRWTTVAAQLGTLGAITLCARHRFGAHWLHTPAFAVWAAFFLSPDTLYFEATNTAPLGWLALAWLVATLTTRSRFAGLALGLALFTTPLALALLPLFAAWLLRVPQSRRERARHVIMAAAVVLVGVGPFILWAPSAFFHGVVTWFNDIDGWSTEKWLHGRWWARFPGFAGVFWTHGLQRWLRVIQAFGTIAIALVYSRRRTPVSATPFFAALSFTWFMTFNHMSWPYFYHPVLILLAIGCVGLPSARRRGNVPAS